MSLKCFSSTFEHLLFHDPLNTLALKGLSSATHAQPALEEKLQKRAYPATNLKSARTVIPTNFYADELIRGQPQIENWKMNYDAHIWVRPRTTTRVELIRGYNGARFIARLARSCVWCLTHVRMYSRATHGDFFSAFFNPTIGRRLVLACFPIFLRSLGLTKIILKPKKGHKNTPFRRPSCQAREEKRKFSPTATSLRRRRQRSRTSGTAQRALAEERKCRPKVHQARRDDRFSSRFLSLLLTVAGCGCHTRAPKPISVSCVCRGAEARSSLPASVAGFSYLSSSKVKNKGRWTTNAIDRTVSVEQTERASSRKAWKRGPFSLSRSRYRTLTDVQTLIVRSITHKQTSLNKSRDVDCMRNSSHSV